MLHLHPLRSRVRDMEHKLKVAMDNLIRGVKLASSQRSPPGKWDPRSISLTSAEWVLDESY